ncbi:MAG: hypothetical protein QXF24_06410 [Thermoproteota archaeon]
MSEDGRTFVVDWTNFDVADCRLDLAWTLLLSSTYGNPEARGEILGAYERFSGKKVEDLGFFEAAPAARRFFAVFVSMKVGPERLGMRPDAAEKMRMQAGHLIEVMKVLRDRTGIYLERFGVP